MEEKNKVINGNQLKARFAISINNSKLPKFISYNLSSRSVFSLQVIPTGIMNDWQNKTRYETGNILVRFKKLRLDDEINYTIKFTGDSVDSDEYTEPCSGLNITNKCFTTDDGTWHLVYQSESSKFTFDVIVTMDIVPCASSFATLHDDTDLTDFELRGEDGSVHIHRAVLATSSPVLRRMLAGTWRETTEGHVDVPGITKTTLQHLKDYVYLGTLPETGLEQLLLLASCYMIPDLEQTCIYKLVLSLTEQNACDLFEFAGKNKISKLVIAILEGARDGSVDVDGMRNDRTEDQ